MSPTRTRTRCWLVAVVTVCFLMVAGMVSPVTAQEPVEEPPDTTVSDGTDEQDTEQPVDDGEAVGDQPVGGVFDPSRYDPEPAPGDEANIPADPPGKSGDAPGKNGDRGQPNDPKIGRDGTEPKPGKEANAPIEVTPEFDPGFDTPAIIPLTGKPGTAPGPVERVEEITPITPADLQAPTSPVPSSVKPLPEQASEIAVENRENKAKGSPFGIIVPGQDAGKKNGAVKIKTLPPGQAAKLSAAGVAFEIDVTGFGGRPTGLPDAVRENNGRGNGADNGRGGAKGTGEEETNPQRVVELGDASGWEITFDLEGLPEGLTNEQIARLAVFVHTDCDRETICGVSEQLPSAVVDGVLIADLGNEVLKSVGGPDRVEDKGAGVAIGGGRSNMIVRVPNFNGFAYQSGQGVYFSISPSVSGSQGNYGANELASLTSWQVGVQTGHAETGYGITVPDAVGPVPSVSLSYSSGSVDGMTSTKNNQGGLVGLGWSTTTPVISRATRACALQSHPSGIDWVGAYAGALCLAYPEDSDQGFTLTMNGVGGRLIPVGGSVSSGDKGTHPQIPTATFQRFVTEEQSDLRIWLVTDSTMTSSGHMNHGAYDQWWEVTTADGTLHVFGRGYLFKPTGSGTVALQRTRVVDTTRPTNSAQTARVGNKPMNNNAHCSRGLCQTVINWHLDQVVDTNANMAAWQYWAQQNYFDANEDGHVNRRSYDRSVVPVVIDYGLTFGDTPPANLDSNDNALPAAAGAFRVRYDYAYRTPNGSLYSNPTAPEAQRVYHPSSAWLDTPTDLLCGSTGPCDEDAQSFFHDVYLKSVTTYAASQRVAKDEFVVQWPGVASGLPADGSAEKMWLAQIQHFGTTDAVSTPSVNYIAKFLDNRVNHPGTMESMSMPRIEKIWTELGGEITFEYGQPYAPVYNSTTSPCAASGPPNGWVRMPCDMFIQFYTPDNTSIPGNWIPFHKYVVLSTTQDAKKGDSDPIVTTYTYDKAPDWAYGETWGFTATDLGDGSTKNCKYGYGCNHWNDYRGHREVTVKDNDGNQTKHFFYTGMYDDRMSVTSTQKLGVASPSNSAVKINVARGGQVNNVKTLKGRASGTQTKLPSGFITGFNDTQYITSWVLTPTAKWPGSLRTARTNTWTEVRRSDSPSNKQRSLVQTWNDAYGRAYKVKDHGLQYSTTDSTAGDDTMTCMKYPQIANSGSTAHLKRGSWVIGKPTVTAVVTDLSASCTSTGAFPSSSTGTWISGSITRYDGTTTSSARPTRGRATQTWSFLHSNPGAGATFIKQSLTYNDRGQVLTVTDSQTGAVTTQTYATGTNAFGELVSSNGPLPNDTTTTVTDQRWGVPTQITAPNNQVTTIGYDGLGRIEWVRLPGAPSGKNSYEFAYNPTDSTSVLSSTMTKVLREPGAGASEYVTSYSFLDGLGRMVQTQTPATGGITVTRQQYGDVGQVKQAFNPVIVTGNVATPDTSGSDANGYTVTSIDAANSKVTTSFKDGVALIPKATSTVQQFGLETTSTDAEGTITKSVSDIRGNTIKTWDPNGWVNLTYNQRNQVIKIKGVDGEEIVTDYGSNWHMQAQSLTDPDLGTINYTYDTSGRLATQEDGNNRKLQLGYNIASQPVTLTDITAGATKLVSEWDYDNSGRLVESTNHNRLPDGTSGGVVTETIGYDTRSRPNSVTLNIPGIGNQTTTSTFRESGGIDTITYPDSTVASYTYDALERQSTYTYDGVVLGDDIGFNARGQVTGFDTGTGSTFLDTALSYESWSGRLTSKTVIGTDGAATDTILDLAYEWDDAGNLIEVHDTALGINQRSCFFYDATYQLKKAYTTASTTCSIAANTDNSGPDPFQVDYTYKPNGNIDTANGTGTLNATYAYGAGAAGPHAVTSGGGNTYSYDNAGNQTSRTISGSSTALSYDVQNHLIGIDGPGTTGDLTSLYDAAGTRVKRTIDGVNTYYIGANYETGDLPASTGGPTVDDFNRADTTTGYGPDWDLRSPYTGGTVTTGRITSNQAVIDASWTMAVNDTQTGDNVHYAQAVVDLDASNNWAGPAVRLNANGNEGYALLARGGVNELRLYKINSSIGSPVYSTGSPVPVDGKLVRLEATTTSVDIYIDGTFVHSHATTDFSDTTHQGVGVMGHNGIFDDFEATNPSGTGAGGTTTTTTGTFSDDFNRANTTSGYNSTDWSLHTPYSGGTVTTAHITSNAAVVDASWTMSVVDTPTGTDTHYAQAVVDSPASNNWIGPAVRLNSTGNKGYAVLARGGANELRLYRINSGLSMVAAATAGPFAGKTVRIEADGDTIKVFLDGVQKISWTETTGVNFDGAGHQHTGMLGHNGGFDDFETIGTTTTMAPPPTSQVQVHHRFAGQMIGTSINGVFMASTTDHLGSGSVQREGTGATTIQRYTPFGVVRGGSGNGLLTDLSFTGQTDDPGTGLIDYNARHYDPLLGRFVMADTVLPKLTAKGLDRYSYVYNNPLVYTDSTGHWPDFVDNAFDTVKDKVGDVYDGAKGKAGDAFHKLPYSNSAAAAGAGLLRADEIKVSEEAIGLIKNDGGFEQAEAAFIAAIRGDDRYREEGFEITLAEATQQAVVQLGGDRGSYDMGYQARNMWRLNDPEIQKTWSVAGNDLTWLFRNAGIDATATVYASGDVSIDWHIEDRLDLKPGKERSDAYNTATKYLGAVWHGFLGASDPIVTAKWTSTYTPSWKSRYE